MLVEKVVDCGMIDGGTSWISYPKSDLLTPIITVHTITPMKIEFDPGKDAANIARHGVSLALAESLEWDLLVAAEDDREV